jgi:hypothetical protein
MNSPKEVHDKNMGKSLKHYHEIRDPVHVFIRMDSNERRVLDSRPLQRLRHIHQLAMSYLVYPGATHRRFEHSLGVMELAGRVFDVITLPEHLHDSVRGLVPRDELDHWRRTLRMAALCHDVGHLPFSHAAEAELLPSGWDHEQLTLEIIRSPEMEEIWKTMTPPLRSDDILKLAVGPKKMEAYAKWGRVTKKQAEYTDWEAILAEVIVGDSFGVDRMDYLLRDSHHIGVPYGRFDHYRLIDTLRILPAEHIGSQEPMLGVEEGGLHCAEALLLARYFMYIQVYFHPVRRIYDIHLKDFLRKWLKGGQFEPGIEQLYSMTDHEVSAGFLLAARDKKKLAHEEAKRIVNRGHYRLLYQRNPKDFELNPRAAAQIFEAARKKFGKDLVRRDTYTQKGGSADFPVLSKDGRVVSSVAMSVTLRDCPIVAVDFVFIAPSAINDAIAWLEKNRDVIIAVKETEDEPNETRSHSRSTR